MKLALAILTVIVTVTIAIAGNYVLTIYTLNRSQHNWCETLALLTEKVVIKPANPTANPSRENAYLFYTHLKQLERNFGC